MYCVFTQSGKILTPVRLVGARGPKARAAKPRYPRFNFYHRWIRCRWVSYGMFSWIYYCEAHFGNPNLPIFELWCPLWRIQGESKRGESGGKAKVILKTWSNLQVVSHPSAGGEPLLLTLTRCTTPWEWGSRLWGSEESLRYNVNHCRENVLKNLSM